ncbi:unnamed protein product [Dibothriocephalus latus]|uniref:Tyrosine-protein phosphatase domain-containing protein n=1 Tax=Dibothriocephalus latus TaxID=60516 RepID=A0A3P7NY68_DIBLA|nr:unnamed protein product [Dibothriocephalus latus]
MNRPTGPSIHAGPDEMTPDNTLGFLSKAPPGTRLSVKTEVSPVDASRMSKSEKSCLLSYCTQTPVTERKTSVSNSDEEEEENESTSGQQEEEEDEDEGNEDVPDVDFTSQWLDPQGLVKHVASKGLTGLSDEYAMVCRIKPKDPCTAFRRSHNSSKNRYVDVSCLEKTRVLLKAPTPPQSSTSSKAGKTEKPGLIYIHANWVDSYRQKNAFICTQGKPDNMHFC